jgi:hypothetical protein
MVFIAEATAATTATAPWWYVAVLAGGFTILGGLLSLTFTYFSDRRKLRREDQRRWDDKIVQLSARVQSICGYLLEQLLNDDSSLTRSSLDYRKQTDELRDIGREFSLIAPKRISRTIFYVLEASRAFVDAWVLHEELDGVTKAVLKAQNDFLGAVRTALRVED